MVKYILKCGKHHSLGETMAKFSKILITIKVVDVCFVRRIDQQHVRDARHIVID
ncbi:hypothetical protein HanRHA438_Chr15g0729791 [Helianthus annuus]|nr:hypothetical protein HanRHA438_Chr15g0729791 [Helianthus annuus]